LGSYLGLPRLSFAGEAPVTPGVPAGTASSAVLYALPGKKPLIKLSYRPPNYETPLKYFKDVLTPNDVFFVRYHVGAIPEVDLATWKLSVAGDAVERSAEYTLDELKNGFEQVEIVAVNQCSGNRRGLTQPHVQGVQWGYGAMGNARWRGVRLKDVLDKSGIKKDAVEVGFDGADHGIVDKTPDFIKSLPMWRALDENTLLAWGHERRTAAALERVPLASRGAGLDRNLLGQAADIDRRAQPAVRRVLDELGLPVAQRHVRPRGRLRLLGDRGEYADHRAGRELADHQSRGRHQGRGRTAARDQGHRWDAGYGIETVIVSVDGGQNWRPAALGEDLGRFSFRPWSSQFVPVAGPHVVMAKATNRLGQTQPLEPIPNPAGYHHNPVQKISIVAA
jgi:DMSO/TMAO reductase YedYZ molybdopterin-dependent catalytic subunit